ncbi:MAG: hypothetical protein QXG65_00360, partial [Thermoplasmata archaeon]
FGPYPNAGPALSQYRESVREWVALARDAVSERATVEHVAERLLAWERSRPETAVGIAEADLVSGIDMAAQGLLRYVSTHPDGAVGSGPTP